MNEHLVKFWLFCTHWIELDTFDNEEELRDEVELLHRQNLPTKVRERAKKEGGSELVLYVKQADRDYARRLASAVLKILFLHVRVCRPSGGVRGFFYWERNVFALPCFCGRCTKQTTLFAAGRRVFWDTWGGRNFDFW